jgi:hypothetical protein
MDASQPGCIGLKTPSWGVKMPGFHVPGPDYEPPPPDESYFDPPPEDHGEADGHVDSDKALDAEQSARARHRPEYGVFSRVQLREAIWGLELLLVLYDGIGSADEVQRMRLPRRLRTVRRFVANAKLRLMKPTRPSRKRPRKGPGTQP